MSLAPLHLTHDRRAVADGGVNTDMRVLLPEDRQQSRQKMFAGDRTGGEQEITGDRGRMAGDLLPCLPAQVEYSLGELVEFLAHLGERDAAAPPLEQRRPEGRLQHLNALAHRRLRQAERLPRPGEVAQLGGLAEGFQMGQMNVFGLHGITATLFCSCPRIASSPLSGALTNSGIVVNNDQNGDPVEREVRRQGHRRPR